MRYKKFIPALLILMFYGCIGTDIVEDIMVPTNLSISRNADSIQLGNTFTFEADYFNECGISAAFATAFSGKRILAALAFSLGVFMKL